MQTNTELNIQILSPAFVVERSPETAKCSLTHTNMRHYVLAYVKGGQAHYTFSDRQQSVGRGMVVFIRPGEHYCVQSAPEDPWSYISCGFYLEADAASLEVLQQFPHVFRSSGTAHMLDCFLQLYQVWSVRRPGHLLKCRSLLLDILWLLLGDEQRRRIHSAHFEAIADLTERLQCCSGPNRSPEELARDVGLSSSRFRTLFKQLTGCTVVEYQNRLKVEKAKDLLRSGEWNVAEAAEAVGVSDAGYFSRMFRKLTGQNPSEYLPPAD